MPEAHQNSAADRLRQIRQQLAGNCDNEPIANTKEINDAYIISASRTPTAKYNGAFLSVPAPELGATAIAACLRKSGIPAEKISDVYMGNVLSAGVGQSPARQAALLAGLPCGVEAVTINKVCASGLKAVVFAAQNTKLGLAEAQVAGGMESMSRVPYYSPRGSSMPKFGEVRLEDGIIRDGLWDAFNSIHMGRCAEATAQNFGIQRGVQDDYAVQSYTRAQRAWETRVFDEEIAPVTIRQRKGSEIVFRRDEGFLDLELDKLASVKPAFLHDGSGTITAANASTMNDGASALLLVDKTMAIQYGQSSKVLSRVCGFTDAAVDPVDFAMAPAKAIPIALARAGVTKDQIALWEINEAFAAVVKANEMILDLDSARVNIVGGAISLGHALGSSGSRILVTLLHQLKPGDYGVAAVCNGGWWRSSDGNCCSTNS